MIKRFEENTVLCFLIVVSFIIKLALIAKYNNLLTLSSDDLNYIKSAIVLVEKGIFVYQNYNEPTVFITPLYPLFLAAIFKVVGYGFYGIQVVRVFQVIFSSITILYSFLIAKKLFSSNIALITAFLVSFYLPNITSAGYIMTETMFTALLVILIYYSLLFSEDLTWGRMLILGILWALVTLCRPTIALYPVLFFTYLLLHQKINIFKAMKLGAIMLVTFIVIMLPWWYRNFLEYGEFVPLAASSGNPMLQGTYVNYEPTPDNIVYYKLGKNAYETNKEEVAVAKMRMISEFKKDFPGYLKWYTIGKTKIFWDSIFYWKEYFGINQYVVLSYHYVLLLGFAGIVSLISRGLTKFLLPISIIFYFNAVHCVYMAFDRYAFPIMPLMAIFSACFIVRIFNILKSASFTFVKY